jgi:hypothetical protein
MKHRNISLIAAVALLATTAGIIQSQSRSGLGQFETAGFSTLHEMQSGMSAQLRAEDFDDRSLVFPREVKA